MPISRERQPVDEDLLNLEANNIPYAPPGSLNALVLHSLLAGGLGDVPAGDAGSQSLPKSPASVNWGVQPQYLDPMDPKSLLGKIGVDDPARLKKLFGERREKRQSNTRGYATGAAFGSLAALLMPKADAGTYFRNTSPAIAGLQSMVAQDLAARKAEDQRVNEALTHWYDTALKAEELNLDIRKKNADTAKAAMEEETRRRTPKDTHYSTDADNYLNLTNVYPGGAVETGRLHRLPLEPDKGKDDDKDRRLTAGQRVENKRDAMKQVDAWVKKVMELKAEMNEARKAGDFENTARLDQDIKAAQRQISAWQREGGMEEIIGGAGGPHTVNEEGATVPKGYKKGGLHPGSRASTGYDPSKLKRR